MSTIVIRSYPWAIPAVSLAILSAAFVIGFKTLNISFEDYLAVVFFALTGLLLLILGIISYTNRRKNKFGHKWMEYKFDGVHHRKCTLCNKRQQGLLKMENTWWGTKWSVVWDES